MLSLRIRNTRLEIRFGFLAVPALILTLGGGAHLLPALFAAAVHEAGHILAAHICGARIHSVRFGAMGIRMLGNLHTLSFLRQAAVSLAGPLMNLLCFFLCLPLPRAYCAIQLCLFLFHILPAVPLDGGTALYCALCSVLSEKNASRWCVGISVTLSFLLGVLGFSILLRSKGNFTLLAVAVYILFYLLMKQREDLY